jgi:hypothetical protein
MICGHCSKTHATTQQVRECYGGANVPVVNEDAPRGYFPEPPRRPYLNEAPPPSRSGAGHTPVTAEEMPPGIYVHDAQTFQVKISGRTQLPYASILVDGKFEHTPGAITRLRRSEWVSEVPPRGRRAKATAREDEPEPADGMYVKVESGRQDVLKVYKAVHGSGKMCAKRLHVAVEPERDEDGKVTAPATIEWEYLGLAVRFLRGHRKMTLDEAIEFGQIYGCCVRCGATLTLEESIERAMGKTCYGKMSGNAA